MERVCVFLKEAGVYVLLGQHIFLRGNCTSRQEK